MSFSRRKPFLIIGSLVLALVILPATILVFQQRQDTRSRADKTVTLSYDPASTSTSPLQVPAGSTISLDVYVDPGTSSVSFVKLEMDYDASKFELAGGFIPNQQVFSQIVEGPVNGPGKVTTTLSIGSDLSKAVTAKTKVGTLTLKALSTAPANSTASISFGSSSQALAVSNNSSFSENVIANTVPATVKFNQPALTCGTSPTDAMLVIDKSGSMNDSAGSSGTKISNAKTSANSFLDILAAGNNSTAGLTTFSTTASLNSPLTATIPNVKTQVNAIAANGNTCAECGILTANQEIAAHKRAGVKNVVILLTDGLANAVNGGQAASTSVAEQRALTAATNGHNANGTIYFTIGLGKDVNSTFLTQLANATGGQYYYSPTTDQLSSIYTQISQILAHGSVSGSVFNDTNSNGVFDSSEGALSGWTIQLLSANAVVQSITTDSTGTYTIPTLCDGSYSVRQVVQSGWKQTAPAGGANRNFSITNGNAVTDQNFGNNKGARCSDTIDNDGNGYTDAQDSTCHTDGNPKNPASYDPNKDGEHGGGNTCSDGKDNNGNGQIDGADPICHTGGNPNNPYDPNLPEVKRCSDLIDNDNNGYIDTKDSTCHTDGNPDNPGSYDPNKDGEHGGGNTCSDSKDNNGDGKIDGADPVCHTDGNPGNPGTYDPNLPETAPTSTPAPTAVPSPTPTPPANAASLAITVLLHGIGAAGDNANPTANSLSNKNPLHATRSAIVTLVDTNNIIVATGSGDIQYSSTSGSFTGTILTNKAVPGGKYSIKVRSGEHLTRLVPGIQTLVDGQTTQLPAVQLIAGDVNNDNKLDILDYNLLIGCYSDLTEAPSCDPAFKDPSDLNDDGDVNQFDYNLFLREISTQPGE